MFLHEDFIRKAIPDVTFLTPWVPQAYSFSLDTRTLKKNDIFVALEGNRVDGHDFVNEALKKGAAGVIIAADKKSCIAKANLEKKIIVVVPDPRKALIQLAYAIRSAFKGSVFGVTGSMGKTSTTRILSSILSNANIKHSAPQANHNTLIGVALTFLHSNQDDTVIIVEMGISKRGEMKALVDLVRPTSGIITGIGHAHMEGLGLLTDIAAEKRQLFSLFKEDNIGIIFGDQPLLANVAYNHPVIKFGSKSINQIQARQISHNEDGISFILKLYGEKFPMRVATQHQGYVFNILAAVSAAAMLGIPSRVIVEAINKPTVIEGRFQTIPVKNGNGIIINDAYNANPESMKAALLAFESIKSSMPKIVVLGDMLELGENSAFWHRQVGRFLRKVSSVRAIVLVGNHISWVKKTLPLNAQVFVVPTWQEAIPVLQEQGAQDSLTLLKASRGIGLDGIVKAFTV